MYVGDIKYYTTLDEGPRRAWTWVSVGTSHPRYPGMTVCCQHCIRLTLQMFPNTYTWGKLILEGRIWSGCQYLCVIYNHLLTLSHRSNIPKPRAAFFIINLLARAVYTVCVRELLHGPVRAPARRLRFASAGEGPAFPVQEWIRVLSCDSAAGAGVEDSTLVSVVNQFQKSASLCIFWRDKIW